MLRDQIFTAYPQVGVRRNAFAYSRNCEYIKYVVGDTQTSSLEGSGHDGHLVIINSKLLFL